MIFRVVDRLRHLVAQKGVEKDQNGGPQRAADRICRHAGCGDRGARPCRLNVSLWLGSEVPAFLIEVRSPSNRRHSMADVRFLAK